MLGSEDPTKTIDSVDNLRKPAGGREVSEFNVGDEAEGDTGGYNSASDYSQVSRTLDTEMRRFVHEYQLLAAQKDSKAEMMLRRIRLKHPIFHLLTMVAFKHLFERGKILMLKPD